MASVLSNPVCNNNYFNIHCCGGSACFKPALPGGLTGTSFKPAVEPGAGAGADIKIYNKFVTTILNIITCYFQFYYFTLLGYMNVIHILYTWRYENYIGGLRLYI